MQRDRAFLRVGGHRGQLELAGDVVAQVHGLGDGAEPVRVVGDTRDRQQLVHAARGQDEPVVADLAGRPSGPAQLTIFCCEIDVVHRAEHEPRLAQPAGQRDQDVPRLQQPAATCGISGRYRK